MSECLDHIVANTSLLAAFFLDCFADRLLYVAGKQTERGAGYGVQLAAPLDIISFVQYDGGVRTGAIDGDTSGALWGQHNLI